MSLLVTERLELIPATLDFSVALIDGDRTRAEAIIGVKLLSSWPPEEMAMRAFPFLEHRLRRDPSELLWLARLVVHRADRLVIGLVGLKGKPDDSGMVEIGYSIDPAYERQGYATEAGHVLCGWAFAQPGVRRMIAHIEPPNVPSMRVAEKLGMQKVGKAKHPDVGDLDIWEVKNAWEM